VYRLMINSNESSLAEGIGFQPGEEIGRYEVVARLAIGGQSIIYKCHDPALDRLVAIKQISTHLAEDKMFLDRFRTEAQILARLGAEQPEVVTIHDLLENKQGLYIVMEFVEGISLERTLSTNPGPVELKATLQVLWRLCSALHTVHSAGVIHRDIKPSNIIIADGLRPMITDFGVAATSSGEASMVMGSTKYMAPELFTGGYVDGRADMYSLGFIAYEMLVGREKFNEIFADIVRDRTAEKVRWMKWHSNPKVSAPPPHEVNAAVPIALSNIVVKMMAKDSEKRFEGMEALGRAIKLTFRPGAKPAGAPGGPESQVPIATQVDADGVPIAVDPVTGRPAPILNIEDAATAPIPKRQLSRGVKIGLAAAALLLVVGGLVINALRTGQDIDERKILAGKAYKVARVTYKDDQNYSSAEGLFLAVRKDFPNTTYAEPSLVYIHMCRAYIAVQNRDWARAYKEENTASDMTIKIQKKAIKDSALDIWSGKMKSSIIAFASIRLEKKAFSEAMDHAEGIFATGQYDLAIGYLNNKYEDRELLDDDQQQELRAFQDKVNKIKASDECDALMAAARNADPSDPAAAVVVWEKAAAGLDRLKIRLDDPVKWNAMNTEIQAARVKYGKERSVSVVVKNVADAKSDAASSGDQSRYLAALITAISTPGMPPKYVQEWTSERNRIQQDVELKAISDLVANEQYLEALDALSVFRKKYPENKTAPVLEKGIRLIIAKIALKKNAYEQFDLGRYDAALPLFIELKKQNREVREYREKIRDCQYYLELVIFKAAIAAKNLAKARISGEKINVIYPDKYESDVQPLLFALEADDKVRMTLAKGAEALKSKQYSEVRSILNHLKDARPEAAEMIRRSKYLENLEKGNAIRPTDVKTAWATYKTAKSYAKTPAEHKEIDELIALTAPTDGS
jgi:tRNA A-37 threonylcarbamoyl transferase component Bud32